MRITSIIKAATVAIILSTSIANAQIPARFANDPVVLQIAERLAAQGYEITEVKTTLLGRYKIEAVAGGMSREIVVSANGDIVFRDIINNGRNHRNDRNDDSGHNDNNDHNDDSGHNDNNDDNGHNDNNDDNSHDDNNGHDDHNDDNDSDDD